MSNIKIHGQKIQFHKRDAISVTLTQTTGGTATFTPETGTSYTLSSLPIGSKIAKAASSLYVITNSSGTTLGSISLSESSGYEISDCDIVRGGVRVAISNTTLEDGDTIEAVFKASTKPIQFYLGWEYQPYGDPWNYVILYYNGQPLNPNVPYIEMQNNRDHVDLDIYFGGLEGDFKFYESGTPSSADLFRAEMIDSTYKISKIEYYDADGGSTYICDGTSTVIGNVGNMGMARILLDIGQTCDLVYYSEAQIQDPAEISGRVQQALYQSYPSLQFQQWRNPNIFYYILYDGANRYGIGVATCQYPGQNPGEMRNGEVVIPFFYDGYTTYSTPFDMNGFTMGQLPYWQDTGYYLSTNMLYDIFQQGSTNALEQLENLWNASDVCDLGAIIYNLATNK